MCLRGKLMKAVKRMKKTFVKFFIPPPLPPGQSIKNHSKNLHLLLFVFV